MTRYIIPLIIFLGAFLTSCVDDLRYNPYGEGEALVSATVKFQPLVGDQVGDPESRTPGNEIKNISDLKIFIFKPDGKYYDYQHFTSGQFTEDKEGNDAMPDDLKDEDQSEDKTPSATFDFKNPLPFGSYKIYVVANFREFTPEELADIEANGPSALKNVKAVWSEDAVRNNAQMFGYLTEDNMGDYDDAPTVRIEGAIVSLNGWIKRLASKVTIVYDGRGLHEGVNIYIKSITIKDIPTECVLGFDKDQLDEQQIKDGVNGNSPTSRAQLIDTPVHGSLYYETKALSTSPETVDDVVTTSTDPNIPEAQHDRWLHITRNTKYLGAVSVDENHKYEIDKETGDTIMHTENMQALYFYENCQGNYPDQEEYNKTPKKEHVGHPEDEEGIYKDMVPYGTFVEIEGYYNSTNPDNQSHGKIIYRFMLGQDATFNYNALRNRHYKLHLGFRGYANQPEWHIVYEEEDPGLYPLPEYNVSYLYNVRHDIPIRLTGNPYKVTLQIIENNWAPYDPNGTDSVAPSAAEVGTNPTEAQRTAFRWYRDLYLDQAGTQGYNSPKPSDSYDGLPGYYYAAHDPAQYTNSRTLAAGITGTEKPLVTYDPVVPYWTNAKISPIWVGFLALQVPAFYEDYNQTLPTGIQDVQGTDWYSNYTPTIEGMRNYYMGTGGTDTGAQDRVPRSNGPTNGVKLYQCTYEFPTLPAVKETVQVASDQGFKNPNGRNAASLTNNGDGSYTLTVPFFTMPKSIGYITGFSGNNPYEAYEREAKVRITAYYKVGAGTAQYDKTIIKNVPVFQQRRLVNPKGVWRSTDNHKSFHVRLMDILSPDDNSFFQFDSEGTWEAWVATPGDENTAKINDFVTIRGASNGYFKGTTGSKIDFWLDFKENTEKQSKCAKVIVRYNNNTCEHAIYVRHGYEIPLAIVDGGKRWSSFSVYAFNGSTLTGDVTQAANLPANNISTLRAEMTVNPLALGTMYKRGNYGQGIRIINNKTWPVMAPVTGAMQLVRLDATGKKVTTETANWGDIRGIANTGTGWRLNDAQTAWTWSPFKGEIFTSDDDYEYDVPTYRDYELLAAQDFGYGVVYADGANETAELMQSDSDIIPGAYSYFNDGNSSSMTSSPHGMRGVIVYNKANFNQVFFPIGYSGVGRRTTQSTDGNNGYLRYGATYYRLTTGQAAANQYRPIPFNIPVNSGAMYWIKQAEEHRGTIAAWDINYFDLSFNGYDATTYGPYGDAIPLKPVVTKIPGER